MSTEARIDKIPNFLTAQSPNGLRRAMLRNNMRSSFQYVYHDIQFVDGIWYAWYYDTSTAEVLNGDSHGTAEI